MRMPAVAQEGHPLKGSWLGTWTGNKVHGNDVLLVITWDGKNITGDVNPGTDGSFYYASLALSELTAKGHSLLSFYRMAPGQSRFHLMSVPVDAGGLDESWRQQPGTPVYCTDLDAEGVRRALAAAEKERKPEWRAAPDSPGNPA